MHYGEVSTKDIDLAIKKLGGKDVWDAWLRGEKDVIVQDLTIPLFDKNGRRIPEGLNANVCNANKRFLLSNPKLNTESDFESRIKILHKYLDIDTGITALEFKSEAERLLNVIKRNVRVANIINNVCLPIIIPRFVEQDIGSELERYLIGVAKSYSETFLGRKFYNHRKGTLSDKVKIVAKSRYGRVMNKIAQSNLIALYFPNVLQGFSILADIEQMSALPKGFVLSGIDVAIGMLMYPDVLARDWNTPGLDLASLQWLFAGSSLCFETNNTKLGFDYATLLGLANGIYSGGLLFY